MTMYNQHYKPIRQTLAQDSTIIITKPDKGRGVVLMDKGDYISKMENLLEDKSTFKRIYADRLNRLLLRLLKEGYFTSEECELAKPIGSRPARLYGLLKVRRPKESYPLCPVTSAVKTIGYGLGKMLKNRLPRLQSSLYVIRGSLDLLRKIKKSTNVKSHLIRLIE